MNNKKPSASTTRYAWTGFALGIACMIGLFIHGLNINQPGLVIMSSTMAVLLGVTWSTTSAAIKKRETR